MIALVGFLCYVAAAVFLAFLTFDWGMGDVDRLAAGLLCVALGLALFAVVPAAAIVAARRGRR